MLGLLAAFFTETVEDSHGALLSLGDDKSVAKNPDLPNSLAKSKSLGYFAAVPRKSVLRNAKANKALRSTCPVAAALDILGDKWTLLVLRDLFWGKNRYSEFLASPEGIPTNILADRLVRLEGSGLMESSLYQNNPPRYEYTITPKGRELLPTLLSLAKWGEKYFPGTKARRTPPPATDNSAAI